MPSHRDIDIDWKSPNPQRALKDGSHPQQPPTPTDTAPPTSEAAALRPRDKVRT
jgi:hypothetical protein